MSEEQYNEIEQEEFVDYDEILEEYRRRQMIEHLTGPMISLVLHIVVIVLCAVFLVGDKTTAAPAEIKFEVKELEIKPVEKEILDELDDFEEEIDDDVVPTIDKPDIPQEVVDTAVTEDFQEMANTELDLDFATDLEIRPNKSVVTLPHSFGGRTAGNREKGIREHGGRSGKAAESAVIKALRWLRDNQSPDGSWSQSQPASMTGLAILAFLAHNELPGQNPDPERFGLTVQKAIQWLVNDVNSGKLYGHFAYVNGIRAYALSEAYAMTKMTVIKPAMNKAIQIIVDGQQAGGGFDYSYQKGDRWDLSVAAWQMQAMKAAKSAGCDVQGLDEAIVKAIDFTLNTAYNNGRFRYSPSDPGRWSITAAGALAMQLLGEGGNAKISQALRTFDESVDPQWQPNDFAHGATYGWYYGTQAMFHGGKRYFRTWNAQFAPMIISNQQSDGHWDAPPPPPGSDAVDQSGHQEYGPYYNTCLNALSLMVYYRYLPTYKEPKKTEAPKDIFSF